MTTGRPDRSAKAMQRDLVPSVTRPQRGHRPGRIARISRHQTGMPRVRPQWKSPTSTWLGEDSDGSGIGFGLSKAVAGAFTPCPNPQVPL